MIELFVYLLFVQLWGGKVKGRLAINLDVEFLGQFYTSAENVCCAVSYLYYLGNYLVLYKSMLRTHLIYCIQFWSPQSQKGYSGNKKDAEERNQNGHRTYLPRKGYKAWGTLV